jgi:hypothetical protein
MTVVYQFNVWIDGAASFSFGNLASDPYVPAVGDIIYSQETPPAPLRVLSKTFTISNVSGSCVNQVILNTTHA